MASVKYALRRGIGLWGLPMIIIGCGTEPQVMMLDQICDPDPNDEFEVPVPAAPFDDTTPVCSIAGDARVTNGMTSDAVAYHFGPNTGSLSIRLSAINAVFDFSWSLEVLARSSRPEGSTIFRELTWGSSCAQCPLDPSAVEALLPDEYRWVNLVDGESGLSNIGTLPSDAVITFRGADIDIVDIRTPGASLVSDGQFF